MESMGYGGGYKYPHEFDGHYVAERYLPDALRDQIIVKLSENGLEKALGERWKALTGKKDGSGDGG
jgi:putative ATPase